MPVSFFTAVLENTEMSIIRSSKLTLIENVKKCVLNVGVEYETHLVRNINDVRGFT